MSPTTTATEKPALKDGDDEEGSPYRATKLARENKGPLGGLDDDGDRERWCAECGARVTIGTDGRTEYGHAYGCADRPENLPTPPRYRNNGGEV